MRKRSALTGHRHAYVRALQDSGINAAESAIQALLRENPRMPVTELVEGVGTECPAWIHENEPGAVGSTALRTGSVTILVIAGPLLERKSSTPAGRETDGLARASAPEGFPGGDFP